MYHMEWKLFKRINLGLGWLSFAIAALVYLLTIGPSASLWDCAEFIVTVRNLEIGHPPGLPSSCWCTTWPHSSRAIL